MVKRRLRSSSWDTHARDLLAEQTRESERLRKMIKKVIAKNNELTSEDGEEKPKGDIILKIVAYSLKGKEQGCLETACCGRTDNILSACVHATVSVLNFAAKDAEGFRNTKKAFIDSLEELAIYREESGCDNAGE